MAFTMPKSRLNHRDDRVEVCAHAQAHNVCKSLNPQLNYMSRK